MKKFLFALSACAFAFSEGYSYYNVDKATLDEASAPYIVSAEDQLLWKSNGSVEPVYTSNTDYFVKIAEGTDASYTGLFASGTGGYLRNMVTVLEDGASMTLTGSSSLGYNSTSGGVFLFKFKLADGATSGALNLTRDAYDSAFNFTYSDGTTSQKRPAVDSRGMIIGTGVSLNTVRGLTVSDSSDTSNYSIFQIDGSINTGSASYSGNLTVSKVATTINGTANIGTASLTTAGGILTVNNTSLTLGSASVVNIGTNLALNNATFNTAAGSTLNSDTVKFNSSSAVMEGSMAAMTTGSNPTLIMNSGANTLSAGATNLSNATISILNNTSLNIGNSFAVLKFVSDSETSNFSVDKGITLTVGELSGINQFTYMGTSTVKGNLIINSNTGSGHGNSASVGNMTIDGGTLTQKISGRGTYALAVTTDKEVIVKNSGRVVVEGDGNYLGINGGYYSFDATSSLSAYNISIVTGGGINFTKTSNMEIAPNLLVKDSAGKASVLSFTKDSSAYEFKKINALRNTLLTLDLNGAEVHFTAIASYENRVADLTLTINDFAAGLVKIDGLTTELISSGIFAIGTTATCTLVGYDVSGKLLNGTWSVDDAGYLFNSALVPEPAEWACIFGALALALAVYRRRK